MNLATASNLQTAGGSTLATASLPARDYPETLAITLKDRSNAIEINVPLDGQIIRAVLSDASFDKSRLDQDSYAHGLGGRLATREENRAVANDLLEKEKKGTLNPTEIKLLNTYCESFVRDSEGGLYVVDRSVVIYGGGLQDDGYATDGALIVFPLAELKFESPTAALISPETALSKKYQLSVVDKTKTVDGVVTGTIEVQYVIPANIDQPTARADVIKACEAREDRSRPAIWSGDLEWYKKQSSEISDNPSNARIVSYKIDFDSKDTGDGKMNMAGHRAYAKAKDAHITPVELLALGAALYYEKTGLDLMKGYWVRAVVSNYGSTPGVAVSADPRYGYVVSRGIDAVAYDGLVAALSPN